MTNAGPTEGCALRRSVGSQESSFGPMVCHGLPRRKPTIHFIAHQEPLCGILFKTTPERVCMHFQGDRLIAASLHPAVAPSRALLQRRSPPPSNPVNSASWPCTVG